MKKKLYKNAIKPRVTGGFLYTFENATGYGKDEIWKWFCWIDEMELLEMDMISVYIENTLLCLLSHRQRTISDCVYFGTKGNGNSDKFHELIIVPYVNTKQINYDSAFRF